MQVVRKSNEELFSKVNELLDKLSPMTPKIGEFVKEAQKTITERNQKKVNENEPLLRAWAYLDIAEKYLKMAYDCNPLSDNDPITIEISSIISDIVTAQASIDDLLNIGDDSI